MPGDADAAPAFALTPPEEQLLALIRDGRVDAEIAVRLAISNAEVKERIERLAAKLGVRDRAALRDGVADEALAAGAAPAPVRQRWRRVRIPAAVAMGIVIGAAVTAVALHDGGSSEADRARELIFQTAISNPVLRDRALQTALAGTAATPSPTHAPTPPAPTVVINGEPMVRLGQIIRTIEGEVTTSSQREAATVLTFKGLAIVSFNTGYIRPVSNGAAYGEAMVGSSLIAIYVYPGTQDTALAGVTDGEAAYSRGGGPPSLLVWATETRGVARNTTGLRSYHAVVDSSGVLFVSTEPIPTSLAIEQNTGESLDLSRAARVGVMPAMIDRSVQATVCLDAPVCYAYGVSDFAAPSDGTIRCSSGGQLEFDPEASGVRIIIGPSGVARNPGCPAVPLQVRAGDPVVAPGQYRLTAISVEGLPLSVALAGDGTLYAGDIRPKVGCPCFPFN